MWMWEKYTTHPFFLLQRGSRGPHNHCLIIASMKGSCVLGMHRKGARNRKKIKKKGELVERQGNRNRKTIDKNLYLKAPRGPSRLFPQYHWMKVQSLENLKEREGDSELALCVSVCVCVFKRGEAAAVRPSITLVKSMPNEDADDEAHTLTHTEDLQRRVSYTPDNPP